MVPSSGQNYFRYDSSSFTSEPFPEIYTTISAAFYVNGFFVVVTNAGTIYSSTLVTSWTSGPNAPTMSSMAYGNNKYVYVTSGNTNQAYVSSTIGGTYTAVTLPAYSTWTAYYQNGFVLLGNDGDTLLSTDGLTWTRKIGTTYSNSFNVSTQGLVGVNTVGTNNTYYSLATSAVTDQAINLKQTNSGGEYTIGTTVMTVDDYGRVLNVRPVGGYTADISATWSSGGTSKNAYISAGIVNSRGIILTTNDIPEPITSITTTVGDLALTNRPEIVRSNGTTIIHYAPYTVPNSVQIYGGAVTCSMVYLELIPYTPA